MGLVHIFSVFVVDFGKHAVLLPLRKIAIPKKISAEAATRYGSYAPINYL
jgi:hypothetical protein